MKKAGLLFALMLLFSFAVPLCAGANMAAPQEADVGSSITFEKNEQIAVLSEVLDIVIQGAQAQITATYQMQNTTGEQVQTPVMFLSPNIETGEVQLLAGGEPVSFQRESYALNYDTEIRAGDWQYVVLSDPGIAGTGRQVDGIYFELVFEPRQSCEVVVSYTYRLGGYPDYDFNAKMGYLEYYLAPAAMWKEFGGLTINLQLDRDMPVLSESSLDFAKVGARSYQYVSDRLPEENLRIVVDENWVQTIFSTLRSPYLPMTLLFLLPLLLPVLLLAALIFFLLRRRRRQK